MGWLVGSPRGLVNWQTGCSPHHKLWLPNQRTLSAHPCTTRTPIPSSYAQQVRATSARAMGSLLKGVGQEPFAGLLPWLLDMLKSEGSSVERSGAAQVRRSWVGVFGGGRFGKADVMGDGRG